MQCACFPTADLRSRCPATATHWMVDPKGRDVPGYYICQAHGQRFVDEYREKLGEPWSLRPLHPEEKY